MLAKRAVEEALALGGGAAEESLSAERTAAAEQLAKEKEAKAYLTPGTEALQKARQRIARASIELASQRLQLERQRREHESRDPHATKQQRDARLERLSKLQNFCSEVGDTRPVASVGFSADSTRLATASWSGIGKVWSLLPTTSQQFEMRGHKDPMTDIAWSPLSHGTTLDASPNMVALASCSMDAQVMLWSAPTSNGEEEKQKERALDREGDVDMNPSASTSGSSLVPPTSQPTLTPLAVLKGHADRCCRLAWHPTGQYVASTSYDKTWRLWDIETQQQLLKQEGQTKATYAIAFQRDGALAASGSVTFG